MGSRTINHIFFVQFIVRGYDAVLVLVLKDSLFDVE